MKKIIIIIFLQIVFLKIFAQCYTIAAGKKATITGHVIIAHNEDDWGNLIVNIRYVPSLPYIGMYLNTRGLVSKSSIGYLWFETTREQFGDLLVNDYGVSICSNACTSKEDTAHGLLRFDFRHLVIRSGKTARECVKIGGRLIEKYGYASSGRSYCIADKDEVWFLQVVRGRHWVARKVPDTAVSIIPNYYTIDTLNLKDTNNFLASPDIISYAIKRNWYNPKQGRFNFRKVYGEEKNLYAPYNIPRHWEGYRYLSGKENINFYVHFPFAFKPYKKISNEDLKKILASHYEGTDFETNYSINKNPHNHLIHRICNAGTKFSVVINFATTPENTLIWWAPLNPCINPYLPITINTSIPTEYAQGGIAQAFENHFEEKGNRIEDNPQSAFVVFYKYNKKINENYKKRIIRASKIKKKFEQKGEKLINTSTTADEKNKNSELLLNEYYKKIFVLTE